MSNALLDYQAYLKWYWETGLKHPFSYREDLPLEILQIVTLPLQYGHTEFVRVRQRDDAYYLDTGTIPKVFFSGLGGLPIGLEP